MSDVYVLTEAARPERRISWKYSKARWSSCALPHASIKMLNETESGVWPAACICCITCSTESHWRFFLYAVMSKLYMTTSTGSRTWRSVPIR